MEAHAGWGQEVAADLGARSLLRSGADVARSREAGRRRRIKRLAAALLAVTSVLWIRILTGSPVRPGLPHVPSGMVPYIPGMVLILLLGVAVLAPVAGM